MRHLVSVHAKHKIANGSQSKFHSWEERECPIPFQDLLSLHPGIGRKRIAESESLDRRLFCL